MKEIDKKEFREKIFKDYISTGCNMCDIAKKYHIQQHEMVSINREFRTTESKMKLYLNRLDYRGIDHRNIMVDYINTTLTVEDICSMYNVSKNTLIAIVKYYRKLNGEEYNIPNKHLRKGVRKCSIEEICEIYNSYMNKDSIITKKELGKKYNVSGASIGNYIKLYSNINK